MDNRRNIMSVLSLLISYHNVGWNVVVLTSDANRDFYARHLGDNVKFISHQLMENSRSFMINDCSVMLKDSRTWQQIMDLGYDRCLIVQDDGIIFRKGIETFLKYDYGGAPWSRQDQALIATGCTNFVGNGGLSLRSVQVSYDICKNASESEKNALYFLNNLIIPEDVFFATKMKNKPSEEEAGLFSFEMSTPNMQALGFHKPWPYNDISVIKKYFTIIENME